MAVDRLRVFGYRSIKNIDLKLHDLNVIVGANGTGKSNLYRCLHLIWSAANGTLAAAIAREGGMPSAMWAGSRSNIDSSRVRFQIEIDDLHYLLECGKMPLSAIGERGWFANDPDIKLEEVTATRKGKRVKLLLRKRGLIEARGRDGQPIEFPILGNPFESALASLRAPHLYPDLSHLRQEILDWRFYHHFRTDIASEIRKEQIPVYTPVLSHDGRDLASALASIIDTSGGQELNTHLQNAFPGARLDIDMSQTEVGIRLKMPGLNRPFSARELSDGTLQYLCLLAALLTERPPSLLVLNEPETSIHPDLFEALAALLLAASRRSQIVVTTHARELSAGILRRGGPKPIELEKKNGETRIIGAKLLTFDNASDELD